MLSRLHLSPDRICLACRSKTSIDRELLLLGFSGDATCTNKLIACCVGGIDRQTCFAGGQQKVLARGELSAL